MESTFLLPALVAWLLASALCGWLASKKGYSSILMAIGAFVISPPLAFVIILILPPRP